MTERLKHKQWEQLRKEILIRDNEKCKLCGVMLGLEGMQLDHIIPLCDGGTNDKFNLWSLCNCCHIEKTQIEKKQRRVKKWISTSQK